MPRRLSLFVAALTVTLAGARLSAPAAERTGDWPHWRGPNGDLKSPLRGIRKDWTGGLRKVFEITDLCPPWALLLAPGRAA
jgi:hypothetical protein